jgi:hypothetical protein
MSHPDIQRNLDDCMMNIKDAAEAMADDMHDAAMRLGAARRLPALTWPGDAQQEPQLGVNKDPPKARGDRGA